MKYFKLEIKYLTSKNNIIRESEINEIINKSINLKNNFFYISMLIVNKKKMKKINFKYRNINKFTNILTFISDKFYIKNKYFIYCDIVICKKIIIKESKNLKIDLNNYWKKIIIHGCLHIIGYDHNTLNNYKIMKKKEKKILSKIILY